MCVLEEYSTQCRGADIDQVSVPTVKEMVWEFSHGLQSKVLQHSSAFILLFFPHSSETQY